MMRTIETCIGEAVELLLADVSLEEMPLGGKLTVSVHAQLWPYVESAVASALLHRDLPAIAAQSDRRARPWQIQVRFWNALGELVGESDPVVLQGTGSLPARVMLLADEMHQGCEVSADLCELSIKEKLPQLRNNLGRAKNATLRIKYGVVESGVVAGYTCQVDVYRLT